MEAVTVEVLNVASTLQSKRPNPLPMYLDRGEPSVALAEGFLRRNKPANLGVFSKAGASHG
jgi:hypothetical protein